MLQGIRKYSQGWISGFIISLLILSFGLWGIHSWLAELTNDPTIATVNGNKINRTEFLQTVQRMLRQQEITQNHALTSTEEVQIKNIALQTLIDSMVMQQASENSDYRVPPEQTQFYIAAIPGFQENGVFSLPKFEAILKNASLTPEAFLRLAQNSLLIEQPHVGIVNTTFVLPNEIIRATQLMNQTRNIGFFIVPVSTQKVSSLSDKEIEKYYHEHQNDFNLPEQMSLNYIVLSLDDVAKQIHPTERDLQRYFSENNQLFLDAKGHSQDFSHVKDQVMSAVMRQQAETQFANLREQLANLTYEHPQSLQVAAEKLHLPIQKTSLFSRDQGTDNISNNAMIRQTAFSQEVLDQKNNSNVIELAPDKVAVIRLNQRVAQTTRPLTTVKEKIIEQLSEKINQEKTQQLAEKIKQALTQGQSPTVVANENHLTWHSIEKTPRQNPKVEQAILDQAFLLPILNQKPAFTLVPFNKNYAVVGVFAEQIGMPDVNSEKQLSLQKKLQADIAALEYRLYQDSIFKQAKIDVNANL